MTVPVTTVLVVGATGQTGRVVAATALEHGLQVRALARDLTRARRLLPGAEVVEGDLTDAATLRDAADGVDAVIFTTAPPADGAPTSGSTTAASPTCCGPSATGGRASR